MSDYDCAFGYIKDLSQDDIAKYCAKHPITTACSKTTDGYNIFLQNILEEQYRKIKEPLLNAGERVNHIDITAKIEGERYKLNVSATNSVSENHVYYMTNITVFRIFENEPCEKVMCDIIMAPTEDCVVLREIWTFQVSPCDLLPEVMIEGLPGEAFSTLVDSPLVRSGTMDLLKIESVQNEEGMATGPDGNDENRISGLLRRESTALL